jgi:hypothetical protein
MTWHKLRMMAFVALCGGTMLQASTGCDTVMEPIISSLVTAVITGVVSNLFVAT